MNIGSGISLTPEKKSATGAWTTMSSVRIHPWGIRHPWSLPPLSDLEKLIQKLRTLLGSSWIKDRGQVIINKYRSRQHLVLLLALPMGSDNELLDYLGRQIESFLFFSNSLGIQGRTNEQLFARWAVGLREVNDAAALDAALRDTMLPYLRDKLPDFKSSFLTINHTAFNPGYRQRFVLGRLENSLRQMAGMGSHGHDFIQSLQIEHVLPQTPNDGLIPDEFEEMEGYRSAVLRLGNVALLEPMINQAVNNYNDLNRDWFARKQSEYVKSDLVMTNLLDPEYQIGKNTGLNRARERLGYTFREWGFAEIAQRQKVMMELAFVTWTLCGERLDDKVADPI